MKVVHSGSVPRKPVVHEGASGAEIRKLIGAEDGAENFTMRMFELQPAGCTPLHRHRHEHEVYILEGRGVLVFEGQEQPFEADYAVFVPGDKEHRFKNTGEAALRFLCLVPNYGA